MLHLLLWLLWTAPVVHAALPEPSALIYGEGVTELPEGTLVEARVGVEQLAAYTIGSVPAAGNSYFLQIALETPTEVAEPRNPGVARIGDVVELYLNGVSTGSMLTLDERGKLAQINVDSGGDIYPPTPPGSLTSPTHTVDQWSSSTTVDLLWSGAADQQGPVAGYSVLNDRAPLTDPDSSVEVAQAADPHALAIGPLVDADDHFFHLRACDVEGNCSTPVHLGPFKIDSTAPGQPTDLLRTSSEDDPSLELTWTASSDATSGVIGYGYVFSRDAVAPCPEVVETTETTALSEVLADGEWYFHVCAVDAADNWGAAAAAGPFLVQSSPPRITSVGAVGPTPDGSLVDGQRVGLPVTQLLLEFSEAMNDPGSDNGPNDVTNPINYLLVSAGDNGTIETADCSVGAHPLDQAVSIATVFYESAELTSYLQLDPQVSLQVGAYRLMACGSIGLQDESGVALDGVGDGSERSDFVTDFSVLYENLLVNPNFDDGVELWEFSGNASAGLFVSDADLGEAATSSAAEITGVASGPQQWSASQCVEVQPDTIYQVVGHAKVDSGSSEPTASIVVELHSGPDCSALLAEYPASGVVGDTGDIFAQFGATLIPIDTSRDHRPRSARVRLQVSTEVSAGFTVLFDTVTLFDPKAILIDGFETGTTAGWSVTVGLP